MMFMQLETDRELKTYGEQRNTQKVQLGLDYPIVTDDKQ